MLLYGALFAAYGTESAFMPAFLRSHGLALEQIGLVIAAGTMIRIVAGPAAGRLADHLRAHKMVVTTAAGLSGVIGLALYSGLRVFASACRQHGPCCRDRVAGTLVRCVVRHRTTDARFSMDGCEAPAQPL
jgi:MFS family permease